ASGGIGADHLSLNMENIQLTGSTGQQAAAHATLDGGGGADVILIGLINISGPADQATASAPRALDIDVLGGAGNDSVLASVQDVSIDAHIDADLGAGDDQFSGTIKADTADHLGL